MKEIASNVERRRFLNMIDRLIEWGKSEQKNNNIYRKSTDVLNDDWIEKLEKLKSEVKK